MPATRTRAAPPPDPACTAQAVAHLYELCRTTHAPALEQALIRATSPHLRHLGLHPLDDATPVSLFVNIRRTRSLLPAAEPVVLNTTFRLRYGRRRERAASGRFHSERGSGGDAVPMRPPCSRLNHGRLAFRPSRIQVLLRVDPPPQHLSRPASSLVTYRTKTSGWRSAQGRARSSWPASENNVLSSPNGAANCTPTGSPSGVWCRGTDIAG